MRPGRWPAAAAVLLGAGAAAAVSGLLRALAAADDPFRGTLTALPWVVLALACCDRRRSPPPPAAWLEGALTIVLVAFTLRRRSLGFDGLEAVLAAAFALLLAQRVRRLMPALRRALGERVPARPSALFFAVPLVVYLAILPWTHGARPPDGDEPYYLLISHSLAYDGDIDLANNYRDEHWRAFLERPLAPQPGDPQGPNGERYSRHNLLLPLLLAPCYRLGGATGALVAMAAMAAALAWLVMRLAHHHHAAQPGGALRAWAIFAFAPPILLYSHQVWVELPAALLLALALDRLWARPEPAGGSVVRQAWALALPIAALPLLKLRLALVALPVLVLAVARGERRGRLRVLPIALVGAALAALMVVNQLRFANPFKMYDWRDLGTLIRSPAAFARGGLGMFYDTAFGLFAYAPIWLLLLPALWLAVRHRDRPARHLAAIALPYLVLVAPRVEWYGGWSPPFRYPLVLAPLLALVLVPLLARRNAGLRTALGTLALLTLILTLLWLAVPGWTYNLADGGTHLLDAAGDRLGHDVARFFPSMVRPRLATWLWPLVSLLLIPLALARRPRRAGAAAGVAAVLAALALVPVAATRVPTRVVELEDGYLRIEGGGLHPPPWTRARPSYRGGWVLLPDTRVTAPVVGAGTVQLSLWLRAIDNAPETPFTLTVAAGDAVLRRWQAAGANGWQRLEIGAVDWPAGAPLILQGTAAAVDPRRRDGVIVDRVDFSWR